MCLILSVTSVSVAGIWRHVCADGMPPSPPAVVAAEDGWSLEAGAVFESLITDRALEAMVVGYAEDGTPFVNLYSIQGTEVSAVDGLKLRGHGAAVTGYVRDPEPTAAGQTIPATRYILGKGQALLMDIQIGNHSVCFQSDTRFTLHWVINYGSGCYKI